MLDERLQALLPPPLREDHVPLRDGTIILGTGETPDTYEVVDDTPGAIVIKAEVTNTCDGLVEGKLLKLAHDVNPADPGAHLAWVECELPSPVRFDDLKAAWAAACRRLHDPATPRSPADGTVQVSQADLWVRAT